LAFLLAVLLSLNAAAAAVAGVCDVLEHTSNHVTHFGHHNHEHDDDHDHDVSLPALIRLARRLLPMITTMPMRIRDFRCSFPAWLA